NGGAEANENAIKLARFYTGRHKIIARYRSYHGATAGAISLTGDPRRWAVEAVRQIQHSDDCRRSYVRIRAHRRMVCRQPLEGCSGPDDDGERTYVELYPSRRSRNAAAHRAALRRQSVLWRIDL